LRYWRCDEKPKIGALECWVDQRLLIQGRVAQTISKNESARPRKAYAEQYLEIVTGNEHSFACGLAKTATDGLCNHKVWHLQIVAEIKHPFDFRSGSQPAIFDQAL
jgi:hypothetical protein